MRSICRPATPPWLLMSATTAVIVLAASPISGARCWEVSWDRSAEIIETLMVVAVMPTVLRAPPPVPLTLAVGPASLLADLAVHAPSNMHTTASKAYLRRLFRIADPPGRDVERLIETYSET